MKIAGYEFSEGARLQPGFKANADAVGKHLEMLRQKLKGEITPQDILDDAKHNNSPLHSFFEWGDSKAAHAYRLSQARGLIRAVVAVYREPKKEARRIKAFVHINEPGQPHYRGTEQAMSQKHTRDMVLAQAWREFQAWRRRYEELEEFAGLFKTADTIAKKMADRV